ncbi:MAG: hypothetical protein F6K03_07765, partial [Kamptonema sp. SIO4C4]|nr:hypothetical protein [Kamptonema sp. SIO4C4]
MKLSHFQSFSAGQNAAIATLIVFLVFCWFFWVDFNGQITGFFRIGDQLPLSPYLNPDQVLIYPNELGYDGQQFLSIALDPFFNNSETITSLDNPP